VTSHAPLRGNKGNYHEGGIRVPLIVKWPGAVAAGSECSIPVIGTDFYPTILDILGLPLLPRQHLDGVSIASLLKQTGGIERDAIYWHGPNYIGPGHPDSARPCSVIRKGKWKMIESLEDGHVELYDLETDLGETTNLCQENPELVAQLRAMLEKMRKEQSVQMPVENPRYAAESQTEEN
jgi:arylsulfatase A-like enzyme